MSTMTISVEKLRLFAYHGVHEEERITGAEFEVELWVRYQPEADITRLEQTIDYTRAVEIIRQEMAHARPLLETVCQSVARKLKQEFPETRGINITIRKINPPVVNFRGQLAVNFREDFA